MFEIGVDDMSDSPGPKLKLRDGVDESDALKRVNNQLSFEGSPFKSMDLSDENAEKALVLAARMQLAKQRQQLMASLVLMGINRIVVTDGKLSAKIMYDFTARDTRSVRKSAQAYDYARNADGTLQTTRAGEGTYDVGGNESRTRERNKDSSSSDYNADYYAKGTYKTEDKPVMTAMSAASEASDSQLQTRVQLAGAVEVNFKSDYLPLDKMATPGMIAAIQGNSTPVDPNVVPSAVNRDPGTATSATPPAATPR
jgi:phage FluMu protein gp41